MQRKYTANDIIRFWGKVQKTKNPNDCWNWLGYIFPNGYGGIKVNYKTQYAHRVAYEITFGEISSGLLVRHECDNPSCVNPNHLIVGTTQDNIKDKVKKGRQARGETAGLHKLTNQQAQEIRNIYSQGKISQHQLAKMFGISQAQIWKIVSNKSYCS